MQAFYVAAKPSLGGKATGSATHTHGKWMPESMALRQAWLSHLLDKTEANIPQEILNGDINPVGTFKDLIENNSTLYMLAHSMFDEVPEKAPYCDGLVTLAGYHLRDTYDRNPTTLNKQVRNYKTMLYLFNTLLTQVPEYFLSENPDVPGGLIGFPFNVIVDWPMGTPSGRQFFLDPRVNKCIKAILNKWNKYLSDPTAGGHGDDAGNKALQAAKWNSDEAIAQLTKKANDARPDKSYTFSQMFEHPENANAPVVNACESFPLAFDTDVSGRNTFWLKGTPYSLHDMLGATEDPTVSQYVDKFVGGTVYQAFLSADSYHCWNAPVNGKVVYKRVFDGTYFAETAASGFGGSSGPDPAGPDLSQRYITHIAARSVLIIDTNVAGGSQIGHVGFVPVGMSEVSTCKFGDDITVGSDIKQGKVIGAFHSGGSTHCLIFEGQYARKLQFNPRAQYPEIATVNLAVNSALATLA